MENKNDSYKIKGSLRIVWWTNRQQRAMIGSAINANTKISLRLDIDNSNLNFNILRDKNVINAWIPEIAIARFYLF